MSDASTCPIIPVNVTLLYEHAAPQILIQKNDFYNLLHSYYAYPGYKSICGRQSLLRNIGFFLQISYATTLSMYALISCN